MTNTEQQQDTARWERQLSIKVTDEMAVKLAKRAAEDDTTVSTVVRQLLAAGLNRR